MSHLFHALVEAARSDRDWLAAFESAEASWKRTQALSALRKDLS